MISVLSSAQRSTFAGPSRLSRTSALFTSTTSTRLAPSAVERNASRAPFGDHVGSSYSRAGGVPGGGAWACPATTTRGSKFGSAKVKTPRTPAAAKLLPSGDHAGSHRPLVVISSCITSRSSTQIRSRGGPGGIGGAATGLPSGPGRGGICTFAASTQATVLPPRRSKLTTSPANGGSFGASGTPGLAVSALAGAGAGGGAAGVEPAAGVGFVAAGGVCVIEGRSAAAAAASGTSASRPAANVVRMETDPTSSCDAR